MAFTPASPEELPRLLAAIKRFRRIALACTLGPIVFIIALVVLNRLSNGGLHFLVSGEPWTRAFWSIVVGLFFAGCVLLIVNVSRRCPRCGEGFFVTKNYKRTTTHMSGRGGVNMFASKCMNCKVAL